jgi:hypothetical protein
MSSREKNQSDFDLETFVGLFDAALTSDNPAVKKALKNLLLITTMVQSELSAEERMKGPLRQVIDDIRDLNRRLERVEDQKIYPQAPVYQPGQMPLVGPSGPNWVSPNTYPNTGNPNWPLGNITCSTGTQNAIDLLKSEDC